jgi:hypothetical protein
LFTHVCPCGQTTPAHAVSHCPPTHTWLGLQLTPTHVGSTHCPLEVSHVRPPAHGFSRLHGPTHWPFTQTFPGVGHVAPLSTMPLQSSSSPLQVSGCGWNSCWHVGVVAPCAHAVTPSAHVPWRPVLHCCPAPLHCTPSTAVTRSAKSVSAVANQSSHAK